MAEVKLWCAVYGEATVFPVKIAFDAKVRALQKAIAVILSTKHHTISPRLLTLYLARKDGEWLKDENSLDDFLHGEVKTEYKQMRPTWTLDDEEYFGANFEPGETKIHVLVELPEGAVAVASEKPAIAQLAKEVHELHELLVQKKRKRYVHSEMSLTKGNSLKQD